MISEASVENFYRCAMMCLDALERREGRGRRFGVNAEALWRAFTGTMDEAIRLDYLCRDAAVVYPGAFSPRRIFDMHALSTDEPFGPEWPGVVGALAARWLNDRKHTPEEPQEVIASVIKRWHLKCGDLADHLGKRVTRIQAKTLLPSTRLVVSGASVASALFDAFAGRVDLDMADQCVFIADHPGEHQLFGIVLALAARPSASRAKGHILRSQEAIATALRSADSFAGCDLCLVDTGSDPAARAGALNLAKELGLV